MPASPHLLCIATQPNPIQRSPKDNIHHTITVDTTMATQLLPTGTTPRYAHLYTALQPASVSFYLPQPQPQVPVSSRPPPHAFVRARRLPLRHAQHADEDDMGETVMDTAEGIPAARTSTIAADDILAALRTSSHAPPHSSWGAHLVAHLRATQQLGRLTAALRAAERAVGLDCIRLCWLFSAPAHELKATAMAVQRVLAANAGVLTFHSLHEGGLAYSFSVAISEPLGAALLHAECALSKAVHAHAPSPVQQRLPAARAALARICASSSSTSSEALAPAPEFWVLRERCAPFAPVCGAQAETGAAAAGVVRVSEAEYSGLLRGGAPMRLRRALRSIQAELSELDLSLSSWAEVVRAFEQLGQQQRAHAPADAASNDTDDADAPRGRSRSLHSTTSPGAGVGASSASLHQAAAGKSGEHRNDSAVAGLGF
ncbi:hypothetical protein K437DRAFT_256245, partial [Tilletiaria anomala UBC 951]